VKGFDTLSPNGEEKLQTQLARRIATSGPITVADYMEVANAHYYATRDPLGAAGDFITAPEISQMFGELVGAWLADLWLRAGRPRAHYVELGPGRGTLAADALRVLGRVMAKAGLTPYVHFVETSPTLRTAQARAVPHAHWHDTIDTLPTDAPLLIVANEFFDALPIHQYQRTRAGWRERLLTTSGETFTPVLGTQDTSAQIPPHLNKTPPGTLFETSPASTFIVATLAARLAAQGGAALIIDYGHAPSAHGDTLQAVASHAYADPFVAPGTRDLTAHVDFEALAHAAQGVTIHGPHPQGEWLTALGITPRAAALARADLSRAPEIETARARLVDASAMGTLFKVMALISREWPVPEGF